MPKLRVGSKAPNFSLRDKDGRAHSLQGSLKSPGAKYIVVYFYPKDNTPGCTIEAQEFSKALASLKKLGVSVIGVSGGDEKSKAKFCNAFDLSVTLVSDPDFAVASSYDSFGDKVFMGRKYKGIIRNTFIIDKTNRILHIFENVTPKGHVEEIKTIISGLRSEKTKSVSTPTKISKKKPTLKRKPSKNETVSAKKITKRKTGKV